MVEKWWRNEERNFQAANQETANQETTKQKEMVQEGRYQCLFVPEWTCPIKERSIPREVCETCLKAKRLDADKKKRIVEREKRGERPVRERPATPMEERKATKVPASLSTLSKLSSAPKFQQEAGGEREQQYKAEEPHRDLEELTYSYSSGKISYDQYKKLREALQGGRKQKPKQRAEVGAEKTAYLFDPEALIVLNLFKKGYSGKEILEGLEEPEHKRRVRRIIEQLVEDRYLTTDGRLTRWGRKELDIAKEILGGERTTTSDRSERRS